MNRKVWESKWIVSFLCLLLTIGFLGFALSAHSDDTSTTARISSGGTSSEAPAPDADVTIDFEDLASYQPIGNHYPGLTFSSQIVAFDIANEGNTNYIIQGDMVFFNIDSYDSTITFDQPVSDVSCWFATGPEHGLTMTAYDEGGNYLDSGSVYGEYGTGGAPIDLSVSGIKTLVIEYDSPNHWVGDLLSYNTSGGHPLEGTWTVDFFWLNATAEWYISMYTEKFGAFNDSQGNNGWVLYIPEDNLVLLIYTSGCYPVYISQNLSGNSMSGFMICREGEGKGVWKATKQ